MSRLIPNKSSKHCRKQIAAKKTPFKMISLIIFVFIFWLEISFGIVNIEMIRQTKTIRVRRPRKRLGEVMTEKVIKIVVRLNTSKKNGRILTEKCRMRNLSDSGKNGIDSSEKSANQIRVIDNSIYIKGSVVTFMWG